MIGNGVKARSPNISCCACSTDKYTIACAGWQMATAATGSQTIRGIVYNGVSSNQKSKPNPRSTRVKSVLIRSAGNRP